MHKFLFLDEVQDVADWHRWIRRLHDTENIEIFITGSSSNLLNCDIATALRGRSIIIELYPLSFKEYLDFKGIPIIPYDADNESVIRHELETYLDIGGFPEIVLCEESIRMLILQEYISLMLYRDIIERYKVRNETLMRSLLIYCFCNTATLLNISKLHKDFASLGYKVSKNTLFEYVDYLVDSLLIFLLPKYVSSVRKQEHNPKKLHVLDTALIQAFKVSLNEDLGCKLETVVFLHHRRKTKELYYYVNGSEIDLCDANNKAFVNTCWALTEDNTINREFLAMDFGFRQLPNAKGTLVYHEYASDVKSRQPYLQPAWKYLLNLTIEGERL